MSCKTASRGLRWKKVGGFTTNEKSVSRIVASKT